MAAEPTKRNYFSVSTLLLVVAILAAAGAVFGVPQPTDVMIAVALFFYFLSILLP